MANDPLCPDGHGAMERTEGFWAFNGVNRVPTGLLSHNFVLNGKGCIVKLWACPVCKLVRIYEDDSGD